MRAVMSIQFSWDKMHIHLLTVTGVSEDFAYSVIGTECFWDSLNLIMETNCSSIMPETICGVAPRHIPEEMNLCPALFVRDICLFIIQIK
jgi:hypothetical protein